MISALYAASDDAPDAARAGVVAGHLRAHGVGSLHLVCAPLGGREGLVSVSDTADVPAVAAALLDVPGVAAVEAGTYVVAFRVRAGEWS